MANCLRDEWEKILCVKPREEIAAGRKMKRVKSSNSQGEGKRGRGKSRIVTGPKGHFIFSMILNAVIRHLRN